MSVTHLKGLVLQPSPRGGTALQVTGTTSIPKITGNVEVTGSVTADKNLYIKEDFRIQSAANMCCGIKAITSGSAGAGKITSSKIVPRSRIFVSSLNGDAHTWATLRAVGTGTASIFLNQFKGATVATASGNVSWLVVNI